jgi:tetratricopeptide (TPR) repeat protein
VRKSALLIEECLKVCDAILALKPGTAEAYQIKGNAYHVMSNVESDEHQRFNLIGKAISCLEKSVSMAPDSSEIWYDLGIAVNKVWWLNRQKVIDCFRKSADLNPKSAKAHAALALSLWWGERSRTIMEEYWRAVKLGSEDPSVLRVLSRLSSPYLMELFYRESIRNVPPIAKAPFLLGISWALPKYGEPQVKYYEKIVHQDRHSADDHRIMAWIYDDLDQVAKAAKNFQIYNESAGYIDRVDHLMDQKFQHRVVKGYSRLSPWAYLSLGRASVNRDDAAALFKKAIDLDSSLAVSQFLLASLYAEKKEWVDAEKWLTKVLGMPPTDEFALLNSHLHLMLVYGRTGKIREAMKEYESAMALDSAYTTFSMRDGMFGSGYHPAYFTVDEPLDVGFVSTAHDKHIASMMNVWSSWGYYHARWVWDRKCKMFFEKAIELDPKNLEAYFGLAKLQNEQFRYDDAVQTIRKVLALYPDNARAHHELGVCLVGKNLLDQAFQELNKAEAMGYFEARMMLDIVRESQSKKGE